MMKLLFVLMLAVPLDALQVDKDKATTLYGSSERGLLQKRGTVRRDDCEVEVVRQISENVDCKKGTNYGCKGADMWVDAGCRAQFDCNDKRLVCKSESYMKEKCHCGEMDLVEERGGSAAPPLLSEGWKETTGSSD